MTASGSPLAAIQRAAEAAQVASHAAYDSPARGTGEAYERTRALYDLLCKAERITSVLAGHVRALADDPALRSTEGAAPPRAVAAAEKLLGGARILAVAGLHVNEAWNELSSLYLDEPRAAAG